MPEIDEPGVEAVTFETRKKRRVNYSRAAFFVNGGRANR
jgi:hypothetical protein